MQLHAHLFDKMLPIRKQQSSSLRYDTVHCTTMVSNKGVSCNRFTHSFFHKLFSFQTGDTFIVQSSPRSVVAASASKFSSEFKWPDARGLGSF
jgi:hypothetical protein